MTGFYINRNSGSKWIKRGIFLRGMSTLNTFTRSHDKKEGATLIFSDVIEIITRYLCNFKKVGAYQKSCIETFAKESFFRL